MNNLLKFNSHQLSIEQTENISGGCIHGIQITNVNGVWIVVYGSYPTSEG